MRNYFNFCVLNEENTYLVSGILQSYTQKRLVSMMIHYISNRSMVPILSMIHFSEKKETL